MSYPGREVDARDVATFCAEVLGLEENIKDVKEVHIFPRGIEVRILARVDGQHYRVGDEPGEHILRFGIEGPWEPRGQEELLAQ